MKDKKKLFAVLNVVQGLLIGSIPLIVSSRIPLVNWLIFATAALMLIAGPALLFGGQVGKKLAAVACLVHGAFGTIVVALIISAASYLYGIYGHHGHALGSMAVVLAIVVIIAFWLVPGHELNYLRKEIGSQK